jgi:hypothetical protein
MRSLLIAALMCVATYTVVCQSTTPKYQVGTITEVARHNAAPNSDSSATRYDVAVRVGNTIYVVLYTLPPGKLSPEYRAGTELPVLVGSKTIKFNDMLGRPMEVPILRRKTVKGTD